MDSKERNEFSLFRIFHIKNSIRIYFNSLSSEYKIVNMLNWLKLFFETLRSTVFNGGMIVLFSYIWNTNLVEDFNPNHVNPYFFGNIIKGFLGIFNTMSPHYLVVTLLSEFFRIYSLLTIVIVLFNLFCKVINSSFVKKLIALILKDHVKYILYKAHKEYISYDKNPSDNSKGVEILSNELEPVILSFNKKSPFIIQIICNIILLLWSKPYYGLLKEFFVFAFSPFVTIFCIIGVFVGLYLNHYINLVSDQTEYQLTITKLMHNFISLLSDFSSKIMVAYSLNRVQERHNKISHDLETTLSLQEEINQKRKSLELSEIFMEIYFVLTPSLVMWWIPILYPIFKKRLFLFIFGFLVSNSLYQTVLDYLLTNYRMNISYNRVYTILDLENKSNENYFEVLTCKKENIKTDLNINDLSYSIPDDKDVNRMVLNNVSFYIKAHEKIAIIGPSGSGKTTLINILAGLFGPNPCIIPSNIRWTARSNVLVIPQDSVFYIGSVKENIAGFNKELNPEILVGVGVNKYMLDKFLSYDARELSGGEKQRIAIARALHVLQDEDCSTLVLDESFSALDPKSKSNCLELILNICKNKTLISILHDPVILNKFDKICFLEAGILKFFGPYEEFKNSTYYKDYIIHEEFISSKQNLI